MKAHGVTSVCESQEQNSWTQPSSSQHKHAVNQATPRDFLASFQQCIWLSLKPCGTFRHLDHSEQTCCDDSEPAPKHSSFTHTHTQSNVLTPFCFTCFGFFYLFKLCYFYKRKGVTWTCVPYLLLSASRCTYQGKGAFCCTVCVRSQTVFCFLCGHTNLCLFKCEIMREVMTWDWTICECQHV